MADSNYIAQTSMARNYMEEQRRVMTEELIKAGFVKVATIDDEEIWEKPSKEKEENYAEN